MILVNWNHIPDWLRRLLCKVLHLRCEDDFKARLGFQTVLWKQAPTYWRTKMSASLTVLVDDTGTHAAVLTVTNLDNTPATGVSIKYSGDNDAVATVDPSSGVLTLVAVGTANISGTGVRGAFTHSDTGLLTVVADVNTGDFTATLALN
jgi:hypothetical protein